MQKREKIIGIMMLIVIMIAVLTYLPKPHVKKNKEIKPITKPTAGLTKTVVSKETASVKAVAIERLIGQAKSELGESVLSSTQDPFMKQKPTSSRLGSSDLVLSGIIWEKEKPIALINDQPLMEGETIADFKIEKIMQEEVILARGTEKFVLTFPLGLRKGPKE